MRFILSIIGLLLLHFGINAQNATEAYDPYDDYAEDLYMDMDFEPNLATPIVPDEAKQELKKIIRASAKKLKEAGLQVELMRDGEVIVASIQSDNMFNPNDTLLCFNGKRELSKTLVEMKNPDRFKIVISMNTDNTGAREYRNSLSQARLNSVYEWFLDNIDSGNISEDLIIIPFSFANEDPIAENTSRKGRALNRRLDIYFIPGPEIITEALHNSHR